MAKDWAKQFYKSKAWQQCRESYISSVFGLCETCKAKGIDKPGKILHHVIPLTPLNINDSGITLGWDNLRYECKECHDEHEGHGVIMAFAVVGAGLAFDVNGQLVKL